MEILGMEPNWIRIRTVGKVGGKVETEKEQIQRCYMLKKKKKQTLCEWPSPKTSPPNKISHSLDCRAWTYSIA